MTRRWSGTILLALLASSAHAQVADSSWARGAPVLDEVVVRDARPTVATTRVPVAAATARAPRSIAEVAPLIPSATVATNSRGETLVYVRGVGERQTAVLLDGAPLTVPWDRRLDLGLVPAGGVGAIDVVRGPASRVWGPNTTGGALDLIPRRRQLDGHETEAEASGGLPARGRLAATHLRRRGAWTATASVDASAHRADALATSLAFSQPDGALRTNTDRRAASALARLAVAPRAGAELAATVLHLDAAQGIAPEGHLDPAQSRVRFWRQPDWRHTTAVVRARARARGLALDATAWASAFRQTIDAYPDADYAQPTGGQRDRDDSAGARLLVETAGAFGTLRAIAWGLAAEHRQLEQAAGANEERFRHVETRLAAEGERAFGRATALVGVSLDGFRPTEATGRDVGGGFRALGGVVRVELATSAGQVHAGVARGGRFPTMRELFGEALGRFALNPDLGPEATWEGEIGLATAGARASGWGTVFARGTRGTIEREALDDGRRRRVNLGGSRAVGVEGGAAFRLGTVRLDASATLLALSATDGNGNAVELTERPGALGRLALASLPPRGWTWTAEAVGIGPAVSLASSSDAPVELAGAVRLNGRVGYRWAAGGGLLDVFARLDNALDAAHFPQAGLPAPGREVRVGVRWSG